MGSSLRKHTISEHKVKGSSTDNSPDYLDQKVDDSTVEVSSNLLKIKNITEISTDGTLGDDSDTALVSEKAVKTYVDNAISGVATTLQDAFDNGQSITIADEDNQSLTITQSDVTNNPLAVQIENDGTNHCLYIKQDGVLASSKHALYVYSNVAQTGSLATLVSIQQDHASSDQKVLEVKNDGTGIGLWIDQKGNGTTFQASNDGTGHGVYVNQAGVLASSKHALYVYSNAANVSSQLVHFHDDNASGGEPVLLITDDGGGHTLKVDKNNEGVGLFIQQDASSAATSYYYVIYAGANYSSSAYHIAAIATNMSVSGGGTPCAFKFAGAEYESASSVSNLAGVIKVLDPSNNVRYIPLYASKS